MINLNQKYERADFVDFLQNSFLGDYTRDVRPISIHGLSAIGKATSLGRSDPLDLQVFEFEYSGSANKRVTLTKEAFQIMKQSATFNALAVFYGQDNEDWRLSFLTANPQKTEKGKVTLAYSNPRRYSFFLGASAKVNTPTKFLINRGKIVSFEDLKNRFSIEVVNKEFYKEISKAFTKLSNGLLKLPYVQEKSQTNLEFAVRLIGRIIFCWFLREKKGNSTHALIPKELLSLDAVNKNDDYYHRILEPIFFEVLNKPLHSRRNEFTKEPFSFVPYLNGGLFTPQDDDFYKRTNSDLQSQFHNNLVIPDSWFKEFFETLETYNFTIDENTSFDEELSIDPEMLGSIFENLLAEINPETGESARKATGSYYTPRTIVNYMVDESLCLYLKQKTDMDESKLKAIISYDLTDNGEYPLTQEEKEKVISALESLKLLDPACGSGAFPIGALQKIVFVLQQIDPDGQLWFKRQLVRTPPELRRVIEREFEHQNFDYIRKLGIIRENIYGIDIQPIATEIARLRCFLTLIVDERVQDDLENRGIEPLPNLDFKFVTANSLISIPKANNTSQVNLFDNYEKIDELKQVRDEYFTSWGLEREQLKSEFHKIQKNLVFELIQEHGFISLFKAELTQKLTGWDPFTHKVASWFDPEWMFGIKDGFDVVIANPPYVRADNPNFKEQRQLIKDTGLYKTLYEKWDLFLPFIERGLKLLGDNGCLCYITSNSLLTSKFAFRLLEFIQSDFSTQFLDYFSDYTKVFEAGVVPVVFGITKLPVFDLVRKIVHEGNFENIVRQENLQIEEFKKNGKDAFKPSTKKFSIRTNTILFGDICYMSVGMVINADEKIAKGEFTKDDLISEIKTNIHTKRYIEGKDIERYVINEIRYLEWNTLRVPKKLRRQTFPELYDRPKIMRGRVTEGIYDNSGLVCNDSIVLLVRFTDLKGVNNNSIANSIHKLNSSSREELEKISNRFNLKYLLAILNSKFANVFLNNIRRHRLENYFYPDDFRKLPIAEIPLSEQKPFIDLVDKIIKLKRSDSKDDKHKILDYEKQIDQMVYKRYGLTPEEIAIVEGFKLI